ncbi:hypothetical protein DID78_04835 [Candidatus Marinamargulisbacteria bacterium SCGC AG-343-D04]|nr:hypothetical protein DID78_04835 [Candidatus Marinamargulisbacteria bacterium SCGC AG-343-D04]
MIVLTCSGTGGHVYPAIACAQYLQGKEVHFLVDKGRVSETIVQSYPFPYTALPINRNNLWTLVKSMKEIWSFFSTKSVSRVICFGGYVGVPVVLVAWLRRIPITLCEQNAWPGKANRFLHRFADKVCVSFKESVEFFPEKKVVLTGNPIRLRFPAEEQSKEICSMNWAEGKRCLVFGGSQGALDINRFFLEHENEFIKENMVIIHIVGKQFYKEHFSEDEAFVQVGEDETVKVVRIPYAENIKSYYEWADLVVSRSGATSVAELLHFQKAAILMPFPHATDNHQWHNAKAMASLSPCPIIEKEHLSLKTFKEALSFPFEQSKNRYRVKFEEICTEIR